MSKTTEKKPRATAPVIDWQNALDIPTSEVESSQLHSIGHHVDSGTLAIRFRDFKTNAPKSLYHYFNFSETDFAALRDAESVTAYFRDNIKAFPYRYPCYRIDETGKPESEA